MIHTAAASIRNARVRAVIRREPIVRRMALSAGQNEHPGMENGIGVTGHTIR